MSHDLMWTRDKKVKWRCEKQARNKTHHFVKFDSHRSRGRSNITFFICYVITWSRDHSIKILNGWWHFTVNIHLVKFGRHRPRGSGEISFLIRRVNSCGHVIAGHMTLWLWSLSLDRQQSWRKHLSKGV